MEILKQPQYTPLPIERQIAIIFCGTRNLLRQVPINRIAEFEKEYLTYLDTHHQPVMEELRKGTLSDDGSKVLETVAKDIASHYAL